MPFLLYMFPFLIPLYLIFYTSKFLIWDLPQYGYWSVCILVKYNRILFNGILKFIKGIYRWLIKSSPSISNSLTSTGVSNSTSLYESSSTYLMSFIKLFYSARLWFNLILFTLFLTACRWYNEYIVADIRTKPTLMERQKYANYARLIRCILVITLLTFYYFGKTVSKLGKTLNSTQIFFLNIIFGLGSVYIILLQPTE